MNNPSSIPSSSPVGSGRRWKALVASGNQPVILSPRRARNAIAFLGHPTHGRIGKSNWILEFNWMLGVGFWNLALLAPRPPVKPRLGLPSDFPQHSSIRRGARQNSSLKGGNDFAP